MSTTNNQNQDIDARVEEIGKNLDRLEKEMDRDEARQRTR